jgi:hypothetical protein
VSFGGQKAASAAKQPRQLYRQLTVNTQLTDHKAVMTYAHDLA